MEPISLFDYSIETLICSHLCSDPSFILVFWKVTNWNDTVSVFANRYWHLRQPKLPGLSFLQKESRFST
jgi:hypothetical protein